jgi:hypothetical protein
MFEVLSFESLFGSVSLEAVLIFARGVLLISACGVLAFAISRWRRQVELDAKRMFEQLDIALSELRNLQEQVQRLDSRLDALSVQVQEAGLRHPAQPAAAAARGYELAVRLAKRGAPVEELIGTCGITRHEAELLVRLHSVRVVHDSEAPRPNREALGKPAERGTSLGSSEPNAAAAESASNTARKRGSLLAVG